jgi:hypothetical protein
VGLEQGPLKPRFSYIFLAWAHPETLEIV